MNKKILGEVKTKNATSQAKFLKIKQKRSFHNDYFQNRSVSRVKRFFAIL